MRDKNKGDQPSHGPTAIESLHKYFCRSRRLFRISFPFLHITVTWHTWHSIASTVSGLIFETSQNNFGQQCLVILPSFPDRPSGRPRPRRVWPEWVVEAVATETASKRGATRPRSESDGATHSNSSDLGENILSYTSRGWIWLDSGRGAEIYWNKGSFTSCCNRRNLILRAGLGSKL